MLRHFRVVMFTQNDLIDLIISQLGALSQPPTGAPAPCSKEKAKNDAMLPKGRIFLSEYEIKRQLTARPGRLTIPRDAIISPLAQDWLALKGIEVVRAT